MKKKVLMITALLMGLFSIYTVASPMHVVRTYYTIKTPKVDKKCRIVFISDIHYGCVVSKTVIDEALSRINEENADIIILGGAIVQSPVTSKTDMEEIFTKLGKLHNKGGIYFVYGNHDAADDGTAFDHAKHYDFYSEEELISTIIRNNIEILKDESVYLYNGINLIGRDNIYKPNNIRMSMDMLVMDANLFTIVADHAPECMEECAQCGVDLQISGHTHGGQLFPINVLQELHWRMPSYGVRRYDYMKLIVSSGMGVGAYPLRNVHHCEYVVLDVIPE